MEAKDINHLTLAWKAATELTAAMAPRTKEDVVGAFDFLLDHLLKVLSNYNYDKDGKKTKGGRAVPIVSQQEIQSRLDGMMTQAILTQKPPILDNPILKEF